VKAARPLEAPWRLKPVKDVAHDPGVLFHP
jgi:hypothetical protein